MNFLVFSGVILLFHILFFVGCGSEEFSRFCELPYFPRHYVAYRLSEGQSVNIDGKLDDSAWSEVGWTEDFVGW